MCRCCLVLAVLAVVRVRRSISLGKQAATRGRVPECTFRTCRWCCASEATRLWLSEAQHRGPEQVHNRKTEVLWRDSAERTLQARHAACGDAGGFGKWREGGKGSRVHPDPRPSARRVALPSEWLLRRLTCGPRARGLRLRPPPCMCPVGSGLCRGRGPCRTRASASTRWRRL